VARCEIDRLVEHGLSGRSGEQQDTPESISPQRCRGWWTASSDAHTEHVDQVFLLALARQRSSALNRWSINSSFGCATSARWTFL